MNTDVAALAKVLADPVRVGMLSLLLDGESLSAGELARANGVAPSTASEHLATLREAGLVTVYDRGRHRYYRLTGQHVAELLEKMATLAPPMRVRSLRHGNILAALRVARTCYGHLAGTLGVALHDALIERDVVNVVDDDTYAFGSQLAPLARDLEIDVSALRSRGALVLPCLDVSERRFHLGGKFASALAVAFIERGWLVRTSIPRAVRISEDGAAVIAERFGIVLERNQEATHAV